MEALRQYRVSKECIGCRACAELSARNFSMNDSGKAEVVKQPENKEEERLCEDAMMLCPTSAIEVVQEQVVKQKETLEEPTTAAEPELVISEKDNVKKILDRFPELKELLVNISPKFKRLENPLLYNLFCRFVSFQKAAKTVDVPVDNLMQSINRYIHQKGRKSL